MNLRERNMEKRRREILAAAREIVAGQGPDALTMRDLASRAGFSVTTLYNLFGNKNDNLVALLQQALDAVTPLLAEQSATDPFSALLGLTEGPVRHLIEKAGILRPILAVEYFNPARRGAPHALVIYAEILRFLEGLAAAARKEGYLLGTLSPRLVAAEIFYSFRLALEDWGVGEIGDEALAARVRAGICLLLLSVATDRSRERLLAELREVQPRALADLAERYPGLEEPGGAA